MHFTLRSFWPSSLSSLFCINIQDVVFISSPGEVGPWKFTPPLFSPRGRHSHQGRQLPVPGLVWEEEPLASVRTAAFAPSRSRVSGCRSPTLGSRGVLGARVRTCRLPGPELPALPRAPTLGRIPIPPHPLVCFFYRLRAPTPTPAIWNFYPRREVGHKAPFPCTLVTLRGCMGPTLPFSLQSDRSPLWSSLLCLFPGSIKIDKEQGEKKWLANKEALTNMTPCA